MTTNDELHQLYLAYFGRPPDPAGLAFYAGKPLEEVAEMFSRSPESLALYGIRFSASTINAIYVNLFNRPAELAGTSFWTEAVSSGRLSAASAALAILRGAQNDDRTTVENKLAFSAQWTAALDTDAKVAAYSGAKAAELVRNLMAGVSETPPSLADAELEVMPTLALLVALNAPPPPPAEAPAPSPAPAPVATAFTATATAVGATSDQDGTLGLYDGDGALVGTAVNFTSPSGLTQTIDAPPQTTAVASLTLKIANAGGLFATDTRNVVLGTNLGDTITGTADADFIYGFDGADTITAGAGADRVFGGAGDDIFVGFEGADWLDGGTGTNQLRISATSADLNAAADGQLVNIQRVTAQTAAAAVTIDLQNQTEGFEIQGSASADTLSGGAGDDTFIGFSGADTLNGRGGTNTLSLTAGSATLNSASDAQLTNVQKITAAGATGGVVLRVPNQTEDLVIIGSAYGDDLGGGSGSDTLTGGGGSDYFLLGTPEAGMNPDTITDFGNGADRLQIKTPSGMSTGFLSAGNFYLETGSTFVANTYTTGTAQTFIFVSGTGGTDSGKLYYDADGTGVGGAIHVATVLLAGVPASLAAGNIQLV